MSVAVILLDRRYSIYVRHLRSLAEKVLAGESASDKALNLIYCRDLDILRLNRKFKGKNRTTDVLAFNLGDADDPEFLGEIYVNLQQARRQAGEMMIPYVEEVRRLTVHGILHLLGYKDDSKTQRSRMWARQEAFLYGQYKRR